MHVSMNVKKKSKVLYALLMYMEYTICSLLLCEEYLNIGFRGYTGPR